MRVPPASTSWLELIVFRLELKDAVALKGRSLKTYTKIERHELRLSMSCCSSRGCYRPWVVVVVIRVFRHS